ncbi:MAG: oxaloacetate decarboxylase subunit alpha [Clostridia bacterium]|nr:oxaloacetate decarboxylase subunit alpha [Clostridia bacterium]MBQ3554254.1 oxaloacetate decarboxylase subunit alpha [Clostridia bacterium]
MAEQTRKVAITETILRDAHQSLIATRMTTDTMLPIVEKLDQVGYHSLEAWGGATFDACLRFLNEDPWERLRKIKDKAKNTKLQMLFRGQNILGYRHYADDIVEYFVQKSIANGIDIIRIFDALNDVRNLQTAINATKKEGGHVQAAISYTISPIHNTEYFVKLAKEYENCGADSICIKDMAGLLIPYEAEKLVTELKKAVKVPIQLHTHYTSGVASMTYLKAIEAGVDVVDCALSPLALGTSQPATETIVKTLEGTPYDTGINLDALTDLADYFKPLREEYLSSGLLNTKVLGIDINTLKYQVPGGMLSNLVSQLKQQNAEDKFEEVLKEIPRVREDLGWIPLVTPTSQIVGTQAVLNVLMGERYKMITKETKGIVRGEYGRTPVEIKEDIVKKIIGDEERITYRPADKIAPEFEATKEKMKEYFEQDEDVLSYALFDQVAVKFFEQRRAEKYKIDKDLVNMEEMTHPV